MSLLQYLNPEQLIRTVGLIGFFAIIFAESGLFIGFFFPGDSLLFTAGFLAPLLGINIWVLSIGSGIMAILGDSFGYYFGKKLGPKLFSKEDSFIFKKRYLERAEIFFAEHGPRAIIFARFIPAVRTFTPIIAGAAKMNYPLFLRFNIIGGLIWGTLITLLGYYLGSSIPDIDKYIIPIVFGIIVVSFIPVAIELLRHFRNRNKKA